MSTQVDIPGYVAGTWAIDPARSEVSFAIKQAGFSTVRGRFDDVQGTIVTAPEPGDSSVRAIIRTASVRTGNRRRDEHLRTKDYLDTEAYPTITFASTAVRAAGTELLVDGDLTIHGVTRPVTLTLVVDGFGAGVARFSVRTAIDRAEYGVTCGPASFAISRKLTVGLDVAAGKQG
jgi:polyisoprenoid-binding protein YceI